MKKSELIAQSRAARAELVTLLAQFNEPEMTRPGVCGDWSLKDLLAHIVWHEREVVGILRERKLAGSDWWNLPTQDRNQKIYEENRDRTLEDIRLESQKMFPEVLRLLEQVTDEELNDPNAFPGMDASWKPYDILAQNLVQHYNDHLSDIRQCLENPL